MLVPFPFTDLSSNKWRPAIVASPNHFNRTLPDLVLAAITSQISLDRYSMMLEETDLVGGTLPKRSMIKLAKVFTIDSSLVAKRICAVKKSKMATVLKALRRFYS